MATGQVEASFQWVFVLLAGIAFLLLFFFMIRACTQQGEESVSGLSLDAAALRLQSATFQPDSTANLTLQQADVSCPVGEITLTSGTGSASIERTAVFLPRRINGQLQISVRELVLTQHGSPAVPLGSALFALDEDTYYVVIQTGAGSYPLEEIAGAHANIRSIRHDQLTDSNAVADIIPSSARTVIFIVDGDENLLRAIALDDVLVLHTYGVFIGAGAVKFYHRNGNVLEYSDITLPAEHKFLEVGAAVSGDPELYYCARNNMMQRAHTLTQLYEDRMTRILGDAKFAARCEPLIVSAAATLQTLNDNPNYFTALIADPLSSPQSGLLRSSCPVIA